MARKREPVLCSPSEEAELRRLAADETRPKLAMRAAVILESAGGKSDGDIAAQYALKAGTVARWRREYGQFGIAGLYNKTVRDKMPEKTESRIDLGITGLLHTKPPEGYPHWTVRLLADTLNTDIRTVWRAIRERDRNSEEEPDEITDEEKEWVAAMAKRVEKATFAVGKTKEECSAVPETKKPGKKPEMLDLEFVARFKRKDGTVVLEQERTISNAAPDPEDLSLSSERFVRDFARVEDRLAKGAEVTAKLAAAYLAKAAEEAPKLEIVIEDWE